MSQENVETLRAMYERWGRGDFWTPEVFDPNVEAVWAAEIPGVGTYHGLLGLAEGLREFLAAWEHVAFRADDFLDMDDRVLVLFTAYGRGRGSGVDTERPAAHVWDMRNGKAIRLVAYGDRQEALKAVGLGE